MSMNWTVAFDETERPVWDKALQDNAGSYQQDWAYGDVMARAGAKVMRAAIHDPTGEKCALAQVIIRPFALIATFALCSYGPVWLKPMGEAERDAALRSLRQNLKLRWPRLLVITSDDDRAPAGFKRVMTGDATVRIDLTQDEIALRKAMDGKWRNRLVAAEKSDLKFTSSAAKPGQYQWLLKKELAQRASRGYRGLPPAMTIAWQEEKAAAKGADKRAGVQIFRADLGKEPAGAMLFLQHGAMATYHIGWASDDGRKLGAHNLILWNAMLALKAKGVRMLDLGGVNTQSGAGIARFKLGTGGGVLQRAGAFV